MAEAHPPQHGAPEHHEPEEHFPHAGTLEFFEENLRGELRDQEDIYRWWHEKKSIEFKTKVSLLFTGNERGNFDFRDPDVQAFLIYLRIADNRGKQWIFDKIWKEKFEGQEVPKDVDLTLEPPSTVNAAAVTLKHATKDEEKIRSRQTLLQYFIKVRELSRYPGITIPPYLLGCLPRVFDRPDQLDELSLQEFSESVYAFARTIEAVKKRQGEKMETDVSPLIPLFLGIRAELEREGETGKDLEVAAAHNFARFVVGLTSRNFVREESKREPPNFWKHPLKAYGDDLKDFGKFLKDVGRRSAEQVLHSIDAFREAEIDPEDMKKFRSIFAKEPVEIPIALIALIRHHVPEREPRGLFRFFQGVSEEGRRVLQRDVRMLEDLVAEKLAKKLTTGDRVNVQRIPRVVKDEFRHPLYHAETNIPEIEKELKEHPFPRIEKRKPGIAGWITERLKKWGIPAAVGAGVLHIIFDLIDRVTHRKKEPSPPPSTRPH